MIKIVTFLMPLSFNSTYKIYLRQKENLNKLRGIQSWLEEYYYYHLFN